MVKSVMEVANRMIEGAMAWVVLTVVGVEQSSPLIESNVVVAEQAASLAESNVLVAEQSTCATEFQMLSAKEVSTQLADMLHLQPDE